MIMTRGMTMLLGLLTIGFSPFVAPAIAQSDLPDLVERVRPSIVTIETFAADGRRIGQATGFFIGEQRIITARHTILNAAHVAIVRSGGKRYPVSRVIAEDEEGDLVLLEAELDDAMVTGLTIAGEEARDGEDIFVVGGPLGLDHTVTRGIVSGRTRRFHSIEMLQINAAISKGSSGSPVMNMQGEVIGIAAATLPEGDSLYFAIPASRVFHLDPSPQSFEDWARDLIDREGQPRAVGPRMVPDSEPDLLAELRSRLDETGAGLVTLHVFDEEDNPIETAKGFFLSSTRVVTSLPNIARAARIVVVTPDGRKFPVRGVVGEDQLVSVACLEVDTGGDGPAALTPSHRRPYREEPLVIIGRDENHKLKLALTKTSVTLTHVPGFGPLLVVTPLASLTHAGLPVVDLKGNVMAVVSARQEESGVEHFLVPLGRLGGYDRAPATSLARWMPARDPARTDHPDHLVWRILPELATERWQRASQSIQQLVPAEDRDADAWLLLALCHNALGEWSELLGAATRAIELDPKASLGHYLRARGFTGVVNRDPKKALAEARDACRAAIEADPQFNFHSYIKLASVLADLGEIGEAVTVMEQAIETWPDRPEMHSMLSTFHMFRATELIQAHKFQLGDRHRRRSLEAAAKAVELAPQASWAFRQLAQSAALVEAHPAAISAARHAVELAPGDPVALDTLARIHLIGGDKKNALAVCRQLQEIDPDAAQRLLDLIQADE